MYRDHGVIWRFVSEEPKFPFLLPTSQQGSDGPNTQREMVQELHPKEGIEPWRWSSLQELIIVGTDVELAELHDEIGLEE